MFATRRPDFEGRFRDQEMKLLSLRRELGWNSPLTVNARRDLEEICRRWEQWERTYTRRNA